MNYALLLDAVGLYEQARQTLLHGLQIARAVRHRQSEVYILQFLALVGFHSGQARITINYAEEALALIEEHQFFSLKAAALAFLAHNLLALDEMQRAMTYYTASIDLWRAMNNQLEIGSVLAGYGYAALQLGLVDQALACIEEILPMLDHILTDNATEAMWVVVACYFILEETNDERLYAVLAKGYQRLMQQTETLRKPEIRKAFLHNCYPHRVIVRAMQAYQSTGVSNGFSYTPT
jgi:tetratricopeptide (TPR) repeat protein